MRSLSVQVQSERSRSIDMARISALFQELVSRKNHVLRNSIDSGLDDGAYFSFTIGTKHSAALWCAMQVVIGLASECQKHLAPSARMIPLDRSPHCAILPHRLAARPRRFMNAMATHDAKYLSYTVAWRRIEAATTGGCYFEVVTLCESILSDRRLSYVLGVNSGGKWKASSRFADLIHEWRARAN